MIVKEHIDFKRGLNPKDAMQTGDLKYRQMQKAEKEIRAALQDLRFKYDTPVINFNDENDRERKLPFVKLGIRLAQTYDFYIIYFYDKDTDFEEEPHFCAGYEYTKKVGALLTSGGDEQCYETADECPPKLEWWISQMFIV